MTDKIEAARPTDDQRAKWLGDALAEIERLTRQLTESQARERDLLLKYKTLREDFNGVQAENMKVSLLIGHHSNGAQRVSAALGRFLAESQARELQLREAVQEWNDWARKTGTEWLHSETCTVLAVDADHTALDALLRAERAKERERIAAFADREREDGWWSATGDEIRALGDE